MRLSRFAFAAAAVLALATPAQAQRRDEAGLVAMTTTTRHPVRVAYRAGIDVLSRGGYAISVMSLDRVLVTPDQREDGRPAQSVVQLLFERKGDSTQVVVTAVVPAAAGRDVCRTDRCLTTVLLIEAMVTAKLDTALSRIRPSPRTAADRLAAAGALGYSPSRPIRVGGGRLEDGDRDQRRYLASLRGPRGERVSYLRLGSCCAFSTPRGIQGTGMLDAYEVRYPGIAKPVTLYLDLYTPAPASQGVPAGFTRGAAPAR
jgi:hypothetical protein